MAGLNKSILLGNLTRDPEIKYTNGGTAICKMGLAVNRKFKKGDGTMVDDVLFINVTAWKKTGEVAAQYLKKGSQVLFEGRLQSSSWEKDGVKRTSIELVVEQMVFLGKADGQGQSESQAPGATEPQSSAPAAAADDEEVPF